MGAPKMVALLLLLVMMMNWAFSLPIPARYDGFIFNPLLHTTPPSLLFEAFFDPLCSDSRDAWPVVKKVAQYYQDDLLLIVHPFPLPYHHNAYFACRALNIMNSINSSFTYPLLELFFNNQDNFSTSETMQEEPSSVLDRIVQLVTDNFNDVLSPESESSFQLGFSDYRTDMATRISFKFGCSRVVTGTPYFFLNGIPIYDADSSWSFFQWASIIEPLLTQKLREGVGRFRNGSVYN